jgi:hypothetical protein
LAPVTRERVADLLRAQGYAVSEVAPGVLGGSWDGNTFTIALIGEDSDVLQVRGTWHRDLEPDTLTGVALIINDWNRDRIWPKVYSQEVGDVTRAHTELCLDLSDGVTDAQLNEALACGLGTGVQFFESLGAQLYP